MWGYLAVLLSDYFTVKQIAKPFDRLFAGLWLMRYDTIESYDDLHTKDQWKHLNIYPFGFEFINHAFLDFTDRNDIAMKLGDRICNFSIGNGQLHGKSVPYREGSSKGVIIMAFSKQKTLTVVKICLEVLYVLAIIGCIITIVLCGIALSVSDDSLKEHDLDKEQVVAVLIIVVLWLVLSVIGLVGIIKEHKIIVMVLLVLTIIGIIANFVTKEFGLGAWGVVCAMLTAVYLYLIILRERDGS
ncbi:unnamed protein product [Medioppia subpectinata]|uniref:Uncharacterized protein n=1 Tax=Medioppia subpectinata TaxID=1979941 RepID=A0A7R9KI83_9ACAR|nr:unnamed protein product [Medioppia subpectinata]CAG2102921.1 unnamed protein product [Medioppia subpectinata]